MLYASLSLYRVKVALVVSILRNVLNMENLFNIHHSTCGNQVFSHCKGSSNSSKIEGYFQILKYYKSSPQKSPLKTATGHESNNKNIKIKHKTS